MLYAPVPYLTKDFPYLRIDPAKLKEKGVSFELAATSEGYMMHGERIGFEDVEPIGFAVVGSVAVSRQGGRSGRGGRGEKCCHVHNHWFRNMKLARGGIIETEGKHPIDPLQRFFDAPMAKSQKKCFGIALTPASNSISP